MKNLIISVGNGNLVSHGTGILGKDIKAADKFLDSICIDNERIDWTDIPIFILDGEPEKEGSGHLIKDLDLEDNMLYEFNYHNYKKLIIVSEYNERYNY